MELTDVELTVFKELKKAPKSSITKAKMSDKRITHNLGDIVMKLRRKGANIRTEMKVNLVSLKRFAVYRLQIKQR